MDLTCAKKTYQQVRLTFLQTEIIKKYSFLDYLWSGLDIHFLVSIDFTRSNLAPSNPASFHSNDKSKFNKYQRAILKVGNIFRKYRNQNRIGLFGYGAAQKNTDQVSFFFPLNLNYSDPYVTNFEEVFRGYNEALERLTLAGPSLLRMTFEKVVDYTQRLYSLN